MNGKTSSRVRTDSKCVLQAAFHFQQQRSAVRLAKLRLGHVATLPR